MMMTTAAVQMAVPWHCEPSSTCSREDNNGGGVANFGVSASSTVPPSLAHAMRAAVAMLMMVPWHCQLSLACLRNNDNHDRGNSMNDSALAMFAIPACLLDNNNGSGGSADNGAFALMAVFYSLMQ
jgi:hypothetical protein